MSTGARTALIDPEAAGAALRALRAVQEWRLPPEAWEEVGELLAELATAVDAGDTGTVDELTRELEISGGRRVTRIGAGPDGTAPQDDGKVPAPEPVRERVVALIHSVDPEPRPGGAEPARPGTNRG
ncbi:CATRA system-associated protein [Streptomyces sp. NPDC086077]|uniref:CATRA system-associated protein n=1 Tax=Streptomyces sp. NPDC086077 TaxID=3154862 RepID=UPI00342522BB